MNNSENKEIRRIKSNPKSNLRLNPRSNLRLNPRSNPRSKKQVNILKLAKNETPTIALIYNLNSPEQKYRANIALNSLLFTSFLEDLERRLRDIVKYGHSKDLTPTELAQEIRENLFPLLEIIQNGEEI